MSGAAFSDHFSMDGLSGIKQNPHQDTLGSEKRAFHQPRQMKMRNPNAASLTGLPPAGQGVNVHRTYQERGINVDANPNKKSVSEMFS